MTNEQIKPGYYWAEDKFTPRPFMIYVADDLQHRYADTGIEAVPEGIQIIAPALPPDQWPTKEAMEDGANDITTTSVPSAYKYGFRACYKLFTGKDL